MFLGRSEYDRGANTFSPEGRLFQVEYAMEAVKLGSTALGISCTEGVILAVERRLTSPLMDPLCIEKTFEIDSHVGCAMSGILSDARTLVAHARSESQHHSFTYAEPMKVQSIAQCVCDRSLNFGEGDGSKEKPMARPYGVSLLMGGVDQDGPCLFTTDPSGTLFKFSARAIGSAAEGAQNILQDEWREDMTLPDGLKLALSILKQVMEDAITSTNVEVCEITMNEKKFRKLSSQEVQGVLDLIKNA